MYLTETEIALQLQTDLNTLATSLYEADTIAHKIVFRVTPFTQEYDKWTQMEYAVGDDVFYTPILIQRMGSNVIDDAVQGSYMESFSVDIYGYEMDKDSLEKVFNLYTYNETQNDSKVVGSWTILKARTERVTFRATYPATDGRGKKRIYYTFGFVWQFVLGGIPDEDSSFTIDGTALEVVGVAFSSDKRVIPNVAYGNANTKPVGATGFTLSLTVPAKNVTINKNLFADLLSKKYNKSYTIVWTIANFHTQTYSMVLRSGTANYVRDQLISYTLTFEEALTRTVLTVDGVTLPVVSMNMTRTNTLKANAQATEMKHTPTESTYMMEVQFGYDSTVSKSVELLRAIMDGQYLENEYTIAMTVTGGITETYTVVMQSGTYHYEQTGELLYTCIFQESAGV